MAWILDLDGVVWRGDRPIPGSAEAVATLRTRGERVLFLTNNSWGTVGHYLEKLAGAGIDAAEADVLSSAQAAAAMLEPGQRAVLCAGPGVREALEQRGVEVGDTGPADAVVVGWHPEFDYARLTAAFEAVLGGARLIATNDDPTYPVPGGLLPGGGALMAAVAYAAGVEPAVAGKPHDPMVALVMSRSDGAGVVVGDRPSTDGLLARRLGARFALVLTGVTTRAHLPVDPIPDVVADDLLSVVQAR